MPTVLVITNGSGAAFAIFSNALASSFSLTSCGIAVFAHSIASGSRYSIMTVSRMATPSQGFFSPVSR
ncbi:MAG: hypothetical protein ACK6AH_04220 [Gemmatimonadota bacterium]